MKTVAGARLDDWSRNQGQKHADACALRGFAVHVNEAAVGRHNVMNGGQAKAGALARLGRKERLEKTSPGGSVHAEARISYREKCTWQRRSATYSGAGIGQHFHLAIRGLNHDLSADRHGIARVEDKVEQDLLSLGWIHLNQAQMGIELKTQLDVFSDQ